MNEQSRINAVISYFFLGPLFLLAKSGTPLAESYVKNHSKKSSKIILSSLIILFVYIFFIKNLIHLSLLGIQFDTVFLATIVGGCLFFLLRGAYDAYRGIEHEDIMKLSSQDIFPVSSGYRVETEEEKVHILAGMIPFLGIWLSKKYPSELMTHARVLGSFFTFFSILSLYIGGSESFIPFLIIGGYILIFVIEGVSLFLQGHFLIVAPLTRIPEYRLIEAYFLASLRSVGEFFRIVFGGVSRTSFSIILSEEIGVMKKVTQPDTPYFMPIGSVGIPFWNLFALPSLFIEKYREYRNLIIQGLIITIIVSYITLYSRNFGSPLLSLLLFPIIHILTFGSSDTSTRSPGIGTITEILRRFIDIFHRVKKREIPKEEAKYTYEVEEQNI